MANLPNFNLPADLPVNWQPDQIVSPDGISVGLTAQHGYNTLSQYINNAQTALNQLREFLASAGYVDTAALNTALGRYLPLAGGTMSGILDMNGKRITSVGTPSATTDAANKSYVDSQRNTRLALSGGTMTGSINHGGYRAINLGAPSAANDATTKSYVDGKIGTPIKYQFSGYIGEGKANYVTRARKLQFEISPMWICIASPDGRQVIGMRPITSTQTAQGTSSSDRVVFSWNHEGKYITFYGDGNLRWDEDGAAYQLLVLGRH